MEGFFQLGEDAVNGVGETTVGFLWPARKKMGNGGAEVRDDAGDLRAKLADRGANLVDDQKKLGNAR